MDKRDSKYSLEGFLEMDEGYFEYATSSSIQKKRGRVSQGIQNVMIMAESTPLEDLNTGKKTSQFRCFKMKLLDFHKKRDVYKVVPTYVRDKAIIFSNNSKSYVDFEQLVETHLSEISTPELTKTSLK